MEAKGLAWHLLPGRGLSLQPRCQLQAEGVRSTRTNESQPASVPEELYNSDLAQVTQASIFPNLLPIPDSSELTPRSTL